MVREGKKYAGKFKRLLERYPHPETGKKWRTVDFERATNGYLTRSYIASLSSGRINHPGVDRLQKISELMEFPFELWLTDEQDWELSRDEVPPDTIAEGQPDVAILLNHLINVRESRDGKSYTNREVSTLSKGHLSEEQIRLLRGGECDNPSYKTLLALSRAFDVDPAYWFGRASEVSHVDQYVLGALKDDKNYRVLRKTSELSDEGRDFVLAMLDNMENLDRVADHSAIP